MRISIALLLSCFMMLFFGCGDNVVAPEATTRSDDGGTTHLNATPQHASKAGAVLNFTAPLSGDQEVPPVATGATGLAKFQLSKDGTALSYKLIVANIEDVLMAHIHLAEAGQNGSVVAWLYPSAPPPALLPGRTNGVLAEGVIAEANLTGPLAGQPLSALIEAMGNGGAYVNVHTSANPGGEVRGQIVHGNGAR